MNYPTTINDFKKLTNGINNLIIIIKHIPTGYYNITKINNLIYELKIKNNEQSRENESTGIPVDSKKLINDWFRQKSNKELIEILKFQMDTTDNLMYTLKENTPFDYRGTYVHRLLYDHILMWIDKKYAIKISLLLDNIHMEANIKKDKLLIEKDNKIDEQNKKIDELLRLAREAKEENKELKEVVNNGRDEIKDLSEDIRDLNEDLKDLIDENDELGNKIDNLTDKVEEVRDIVQVRNMDVNIKPNNFNDLHMFIILQEKNRPNIMKVFRGQNKHVSKNMSENYNIIINKTYNPNPIDLWVAIKNYYKDMNNNIKEEIKTDRRNKVISVKVKQERLHDLQMYPPIRINNCNIIINFDKYPLETFINMVKQFDGRRFTLPVP